MLEANVAMHLRKTQQRLTQLMKGKIDEYGLTFRLLHIIMLIDKYPDANQKEIAEMMRFTKGAMSIAIKKLKKLKMVEQIPLEEDLRSNKLRITEHGQRIIADYEEHVRTRYKELFLGFKEAELMEFNRYLAKINENLDCLEQIENK